MHRQASKKRGRAFTEKAAVNLEDAKGVGGIEGMVGFEAESLRYKEAIETGGRGEVVVG